MHAEEELLPVAELNRPAAQGIGATIALALQYAPGMHSLHALSFVEPARGLKLGARNVRSGARVTCRFAETQCSRRQRGAGRGGVAASQSTALRASPPSKAALAVALLDHSGTARTEVPASANYGAAGEAVIGSWTGHSTVWTGNGRGASPACRCPWNRVVLARRAKLTPCLR